MITVGGIEDTWEGVEVGSMRQIMISGNLDNFRSDFYNTGKGTTLIRKVY